MFIAQFIACLSRTRRGSPMLLANERQFQRAIEGQLDKIGDRCDRIIDETDTLSNKESIAKEAERIISHAKRIVLLVRDTV